MITTFLNERGMNPWIYTYEDYRPIDTEVEKNLRPWLVKGESPPPEICDLLTASDYTFKFEFNSSAFNKRYDLLDENGEGGFPKDISFSKSVKAGNWFSKTKSQYGRGIFGEGDDIEKTYNEKFTWDTRSKLFEGYSDEVPINARGFCGLEYQEFIELAQTDEETGVEFSNGYWYFYVIMNASGPYLVYNEQNEPFWTCNNPFFGYISRTDFGSFALLGGNPPTDFTRIFYEEGRDDFPIGSTYIDIESYGGQGEGQEGIFPSASISIKNHFKE